MSTTNHHHSHENAIAALKAHLASDLNKAAEPIIQKALQDYEVEVRKRVASAVMAIIDRSFEVNTSRDVLTIRIDYRDFGGKR